MGMGISLARAGGPMTSMDTTAAARVAQLKAAGATVSVAQAFRISSFIRAEKGAGRWSSHKRIFIPGWGVAAANAIDLVTGATGTWVNAPSQGAGYFQGNGTNQCFEFGVSPATLGLIDSSHMFGVLVKQAQTNGVDYISAQTSNMPMRIITQGGSGNQIVSFESMNSNTVSQTSIPTGILAVSRTSATACSSYIRRTSGLTTSLGLTTSTAGASVVHTFAAGCRSAEGSYSGFSDGQIGAMFAGLGLDAANMSGFTLNLKTLWEGLFSLTLP